MIKVKYVWKGEAALAQFRDGIANGLNKVMKLWIVEVKRLIDSPKSGRIYGGHQASAPGEPPARITGGIANGCRFAVRKNKHSVTAQGRNIDPKITLMERGTRNMRPGPVLGVAMKNIQPLIEMTLAEEVRKATNYRSGGK